MKIHSDDLRTYPNALKVFPTEFMSESQALANHGQSLERLDTRGGMSYYEIWCNLRGNGFEKYDKRFNYCRGVMHKKISLEAAKEAKQ